MIGPRQVEQASLSYQFSLERHVPAGHLLRAIDRFVDLSALRRELAPFYSSTGRPSVDPELMLRMLLVGYCFGIRSERRLCDEVHLNLAYRWFRRLGLEATCPITQPSRRTGTAASATATCCAGYSRRFWSGASRRGSSGAKASRSTAADQSRRQPADGRGCGRLDPAGDAETGGRGILGRSTMPPSGPRHRLSRSSSRRPTLPPAGPEPMAGWPTSLTIRTISWTSTTPSLSMSSPPPRSARPR